MHWSTVLLPLAALAYAYLNDLGSGGALWLLFFVLAILLCVLLHELGHAAAARHFSVRVHDIVLLPIGGAARLSRVPRHARHEALIALAGPAVNLLVALVLLPALFQFPQHEWYPWLGNFTPQAFVVCLALFNALVCAFNLLPIFPLDGGRVLRATLTNWMPRLTATRVTSVVARILSMLALGYAFYDHSFYLGAFAVYTFFVAGREVHGAKIQTFLDERLLGEVALPMRVFGPSTPVEDLRSHLRRNEQLGAVIADDCSPIGFVTFKMLSDVEGLRPVGDLELLAVVCHDADTPLRELSRQFAEHPTSVAIEEIDFRPVGYADLELLDEAYQAYAKTA